MEDVLLKNERKKEKNRWLVVWLWITFNTFFERDRFDVDKTLWYSWNSEEVFNSYKHKTNIC